MRKDIGGLHIPGADRLDIDVEAEAEEYRSWLVDELERHDVAILQLPPLEHELIADWAVQKRRPFKESGAGYRDALIWGTVVHCSASEPVIFVSSNSSDFAATRKNPAVLHPDLIDDLSGTQPDQVTLCPNLAHLVELVTTPEQRVAETLQQQLSTQGSILRTRVVELVREPMLSSPTDRLRLDRGEGYVDELFAEEVYEPFTFILGHVSDLGTGEYLVQMEIEADVDLSVTWWESEPILGALNWDRCHSDSATATLTFPAEAVYSESEETFRDVTTGAPTGSFRVSW